MNQSELIEKVAQATKLNQATAGQAVKAVVNAILDGLLAGEAVRVSGLGIFNVAARPPRGGRNPRTGETIRQGRQRCPQSADSEGGSPEEARTTKEIRGAEVNVLSMCGRAGTAASAQARCTLACEMPASSAIVRQLHRARVVGGVTAFSIA